MDKHKYAAYCRRAVEEGCVLLENDGTLPFLKNERIAIYSLVQAQIQHRTQRDQGAPKAAAPDNGRDKAPPGSLAPLYPLPEIHQVPGDKGKACQHAHIAGQRRQHAPYAGK